MANGEQLSYAFYTSEYVEDLIKDFLYFRGYSSTLKALENDQRNCRDKILQPAKIVKEIQTQIDSHDLSGLRDYWGYLHKQFFSRLERDHLESIRKIETGILRLYLTSAIKEGKRDKVNEFFEMLSSELQHLSEWKDWFAVPFLKGIQEHPKFGRYFGKPYFEKVMVSLHNFISTILAYMPRPILLRFEDELVRSKTLIRENDSLVQQLSQANLERRSVDEELQRSKKQIRDKDKQLNLLKQQLTDLANSKVRQLPLSVTDVPNLEHNYTSELRNEYERHISVGSEPSEGPKSLDPTFKWKQPSPATGSQVVAGVPDENGEDPFHSVTNDALGGQAIPQSKETQSSSKPLENTALGVCNFPDDNASTHTDDSFVADENIVTFYNCDQLNDAPFLFLSQDRYTNHGSPITHCMVAPGGKYVASADCRGIVRVWEFGKGIVDIHKVNCSAFQVLSLEWESHYGQSMFIGGNNAKVQLHSIANKKLQHELELNDQFPRVISIACHPINNSFVLACSESGQFVRAILDSTPAPKRNLIKSPIALVDQHRLGTLTIWDWKTLKITSRIDVQPRPFSITTTSFNHNGNLLLTGGVDGMVRLYDLSNQGCILGWHAHSGEVSNLMFSNDENSIFSMGSDGKFTQWSIQNMGQRIQDIPVEVDACIPHLIMSKGEQVPLNMSVGKLFAFDSDSDHVLTCGNPRAHVYKIIRPESAEDVLSIGGHDGVVTCVDWSSYVDRCFCITGSSDGTINVTTLLRNHSLVAGRH